MKTWLLPLILVLPFSPYAQEFLTNRPANVPSSTLGTEYVIGKDDLLEITVFEVPTLSSIPRVTASGTISLPLIGVVQASGKTTQQLETLIEDALKKKYVNDPNVTVFIKEYASQPVTIMGAVKAGGIYQIKGQKFLLDMLATAGGLDDTAGKLIHVIRRKPVSEQVSDNSEQGESITITINIEDLVQNLKTELNIPIYANDTINVLKAGSIFVLGEVGRPGEVPLRYGRDVTVTQALAYGGGATKESKKKSAKIIRIHRDSTKEEIPVNLDKILNGSHVDVPLQPNDILFVPGNKVKVGINRAVDAAIGIISGRLVYAR